MGGIITINTAGKMVYVEPGTSVALDALTWEAMMAGCGAPNSVYCSPGPVTHEGSGARNFDAPSESELAYAAMEAATQRLVNAVKGETVACAMTAMHAQRRSDGRPVPYLPEENL